MCLLNSTGLRQISSLMHHKDTSYLVHLVRKQHLKVFAKYPKTVCLLYKSGVLWQIARNDPTCVSCNIRPGQTPAEHKTSCPGISRNRGKKETSLA